MLKGVYKHLRNTQVFQKYAEKVSEFNADALGIFITFGLIISLIAIVLELTVLRTRDFWCVIVLAVYFLILMLYYHKHIEQTVDHSTLFLYLTQIPVILLAVFMGSWLNPAEKAFSILVIMVSFPTFILDKPRRVLLYIVGIAIVFILADIRYKTGMIMLHDIVHTVVTACISLCTTIYVLDNRIENVEKSQTFLTDSEHDPLTGIYNRRGGEEKIRECIAEGIGGTLILLDVDDFKHVNDTYGHVMGDEILNMVAMTLSNAFRSTDVVMRMGGDEFIVYAPGLVNYFFIDGKLQQINSRMREITCAQGKDNITVSMGAVINDGTYPDYESVFNEADALLYEVKSHGKNSFKLQARSYHELKNKETAERIAQYRADREAANEAEEAKYKDQ